MKFNFCPTCGYRLIEKRAGDDGLVPYCEHCNVFHFPMFPTCSIILVVNEDGEVALIRQGYISHKYLNLIAGYIQPGEKAEAAALREVEEEIGQQVEELCFVSTNWFEPKEILMHCYIGKVKKKDFVLSSEVEEAAWYSPEEALKLVHPGQSLSTLLIKEFIENRERYMQWNL